MEREEGEAVIMPGWLLPWLSIAFVLIACFAYEVWDRLKRLKGQIASLECRILQVGTSCPECGDDIKPKSHGVLACGCSEQDNWSVTDLPECWGLSRDAVLDYRNRVFSPTPPADPYAATAP